MGSSATAKLVYGYDLGGDDAGWKVKEKGEYGELSASWYETDSVEDALENALLAAAGFTDTWTPGDVGYYERRGAALEQFGVKIVTYCMLDSPSYLLAAGQIRAEEDSTTAIDLASLTTRPEREGWDAKLHTAIKTLGLTPEQAQPAWLLCSMYS
ncbi:hypothetical protein [Streptomyces sp. NBC_01304]|uniref:hypothetical protein n=1 Tax=Streptomyces sp. NBC_01304 TaxID=2903818 RepID=UPI002E11ED50|nr:hypothetical protein OG430_47510 [Streptomyces sp. NBC_01304]